MHDLKFNKKFSQILFQKVYFRPEFFKFLSKYEIKNFRSENQPMSEIFFAFILGDIAVSSTLEHIILKKQIAQSGAFC